MPNATKRVKLERADKKQLVETAVLLLGLHFTRNFVQERPPLLPANPFEDMDDLYFETKFRYTKEEVWTVVNCLNLPEKVVLPKEYTCTGTTMLLVVLFRLSFPTTLLFMERVFGIKIEKLSRIFNNGIAYLHDKFRAKLNLDVYYLGISDKCGNLLEHCMGFIDAMRMRFCRPIVSRGSVQRAQKSTWPKIPVYCVP